MPNWCYDDVTFIQADGGHDRLVALKELLDSSDGFCPDADSYWIGNVLVKAGICSYDEANQKNTRSFINEVGEVKENTLQLTSNSAWYPRFEAYNLLAKHFDLDYEILAEEPGCGVFINSDVEGKYYDTRYRLWDDESHEYEEQYFTSKEKVLNYLKDKKGYTGTTHEELMKFLEENDLSLDEFDVPKDEELCVS